MTDVSDRIDQILSDHRLLADEIGEAAALQKLAARLERAERSGTIRVVSSDDEEGPVETYHGPIEVGSHFIWRINVPHAWAHLIVTQVDAADSRGTPFDERRIWTEVLHGTGMNRAGSRSWNEEGHFREAVTPIDKYGNIIPGTRWVDERK